MRYFRMPRQQVFLHILATKREKFCYPKQLTLMRFTQGTLPTTICDVFPGARVKSMRWGTVSKLGWCHLVFKTSDEATAALTAEKTSLGRDCIVHRRPKISLSQFYELCPPDCVDPVQSTCVCWRCTNAKLIWEAVSDLILTWQGDPKMFVEDKASVVCDELAEWVQQSRVHAVVDGVQLAPTVDDLLAVLCCPREKGRYFGLACCRGECPACQGPKGILELNLSTEAIDFLKLSKKCKTYDQYLLRDVYTEDQKAKREVGRSGRVGRYLEV